MRILFLSWQNFGNPQMMRAFRELGHEVIEQPTTQEDMLTGTVTDVVNNAARRHSPDIIYSFNYFPHVARASAGLGLDYYSWVYDCPCVQLYSATTILPTNHIYVFDSDTWLRFHSQGIETVHFLPMAAEPVRAGELSIGRHFDRDITFVGSLYDEEHDFYSRMTDRGLDEYAYGYVRGIIEAQKEVYGINLAQNILTDSVIGVMHEALPLEPDADSVITHRDLFSEYVINRRTTAEERKEILSLLGEHFGDVALYTRDRNARIPGCDNLGVADFRSQTSQIYAASRINLNISLRSIVNGIPLRCFEIMGAGGFLLTNWAGDFGQFFEEGRDYVSYESKADLLDKCEYYLGHESEREAIARNGYERICAAHTYRHRAEEMLG